MKDFDPNSEEDCKEWLKMWGEQGETTSLSHELALAHAKRMTEPCEWREEENGGWECGTFHEFHEGGPTANGFHFCPYCAHPIKEVPFKDKKVRKPTQSEIDELSF